MKVPATRVFWCRFYRPLQKFVTVVTRQNLMAATRRKFSQVLHKQVTNWCWAVNCGDATRLSVAVLPDHIGQIRWADKAERPETSYFAASNLWYSAIDSFGVISHSPSVYEHTRKVFWVLEKKNFSLKKVFLMSRTERHTSPQNGRRLFCHHLK